MNKIIIDNNIINNYKDDYIEINNNTIVFIKNNEYQIEYINSNNINVNYIINSNITVKLSIYSDNDNLIINNNYTLKENSNLLLFKFYNNKTIKENITINLEGIYSQVSYFFSTICTNNESYNIKIIHNNKYTKSYISNKCIALNNSTITYTIDSIVPACNINSIMDQNTKIIELGTANATIKPNMYIEENDVEAKHGSVIGNFNEEEIFYLMSRGINKNDAIKLLSSGFILSHLLVSDELTNKIKDIINKNWR